MRTVTIGIDVRASARPQQPRAVNRLRDYGIVSFAVNRQADARVRTKRIACNAVRDLAFEAPHAQRAMISHFCEKEVVRLRPVRCDLRDG